MRFQAQQVAIFHAGDPSFVAADWQRVLLVQCFHIDHTWQEQAALLAELPNHLQEMALFVLNTGVRDDVVCNLQWDWEIPVPELGVSVFETPVAHVKGRRASKLVVCNSVAQAVVERARERHPTHVFVMNGDITPSGQYKR